MKNKKCPERKFCFSYKGNACEGCAVGDEILKLYKRIDRLKKQNETLTIQRNAWALTAKALAPKWISVDERLPDGYGSFLVAFKSKLHWKTEWVYCVGVAIYNVSEIPSVNGWDFEIGDGYEYIITHWMPLPEAPNMKGDKE